MKGKKNEKSQKQKSHVGSDTVYGPKDGTSRDLFDSYSPGPQKLDDGHVIQQSIDAFIAFLGPHSDESRLNPSRSEGLSDTPRVHRGSHQHTMLMNQCLGKGGKVRKNRVKQKTKTYRHCSKYICSCFCHRNVSELDPERTFPRTRKVPSLNLLDRFRHSV